MPSREYRVTLRRLGSVQAYRVYADRSVDAGHIIDGEFVPGHTFHYTTDERQRRDKIADYINLARALGYEITRRTL